MISVTSTGPGTPTAGNPTHWGVGTASGQIVLETAGPFAQPMQPINMIIGPPDASGNYSNSNSSINDGHFSPYINGTGTFVISDAAITAATVITAVNFDFGTQPDTTLPGTTPRLVTTPEPASLTLLGAGLLAVGFVRRRRHAAYGRLPHPYAWPDGR